MTPDGLESSLRLFLSVDISGSTAFKHSSKNPAEWQYFFYNFYYELHQRIHVAYSDNICKLTTWKWIGDEVVFTAELLEFDAIPKLVNVFREVVFGFRKEILRIHNGRVDAKIAGWTAGFPVGNMMIESPPDLKRECDYIGPSMDIGFRLVKVSDPRRMFISVELAWLLTHPKVPDANRMNLYFHGPVALKGVGKDGFYPGVWLDNFKDASSPFPENQPELKEEELIGSGLNPSNRNSLHDYCSQWLKRQGFPFMEPFIKDNPVIGQIPDQYEAKLKELIQAVKAKNTLEETDLTDTHSAVTDESERVKKISDSFRKLKRDGK